MICYNKKGNEIKLLKKMIKFILRGLLCIVRTFDKLILSPKSERLTTQRIYNKLINKERIYEFREI
jgi:hypothetical protein